MKMKMEKKKNVLEEERFELSTFRMRSEHSTSELHPQLKISRLNCNKT